MLFLRHVAVAPFSRLMGHVVKYEVVKIIAESYGHQEKPSVMGLGGRVSMAAIPCQI